MRQIRVFYKKVGVAKYISHLDLNRCFARALRRARLPVWYTEGFNPHIRIVFSLPAPLGLECLNESMDLRLNEDVPAHEFKSRLNRQLPEGLEILSVKQPVMKPDSIAYAQYSIELSHDGKTGAETANIIKDCLDSNELLIEKKSKSGIKHIDILPKINQVKLETRQGSAYMELILPAGSGENINPFLLIRAMQKKAGEQFVNVNAVRHRLFNKNMIEFC